MKEAELYAPLEQGRVKCTACARYCQLGEGQIGLCGIRQNLGGKLQLLSYGKLFTGHIDPIEKKPVTHYHPGTRIFSVATSGCNWLCHPKGTQILMSDGSSKGVEEILPGDSLWSYDLEHQMKIVPNIVTHVGTRVARIWEIGYGKQGKKTYLTAEHPVLTRAGWKAAEELKQGDEILKVWYQDTSSWKEKRSTPTEIAIFHCGRCSQTFTGLKDWNKHRGTCYTEGLEKSPEVLASHRKRMIERNPMRDPEVATGAIATTRARFLIDESHGWHRNAESLRDWLHQHQSSSQKRLYEILDGIGTCYEKEFRIICNDAALKSGANRSYIADAAFPELKLDIEVDGWHDKNEAIKAQDKVRDRALYAMGWDVIRLGRSYVYNHSEEVKALILERLAPKPMVNKREWLSVSYARPTERTEKVFGIETIPNHNYVADQFIVHNCRYCQNFDISQRRKVEGMDISPNDVPKLAINQGCQGIAYTYNEPSIFIEFARDIGLEAHKKGLFNIFVSNGYDTPSSVKMMSQFLDCITVDFKGSGETGFVRKYIGIPSAEPIFETLLELKKKTKIHVEITDLIVPQVGDNLEQARKLSKWIRENLGEETAVHFLRFHPDYKMMDLPVTPLKTLEAHHKVAKEEGLKYVYLGNVPGHPLENTFCAGCGSIVVGRYGYEITSWQLDSHNRCNKCGCQIPIEGELASTVNEERFLPAYF